MDRWALLLSFMPSVHRISQLCCEVGGGAGKRILACHLFTRQVSPCRCHLLWASACASGNRESHMGLLRGVVGEVLARSPSAVPGRCHTS